ncbi:MAG: biopolymer transporter ExbD [Campylobacterales bacterium]|nr:biopolymer transporter ExbD [Campylobacterales bacterium]
MKRDYLNHNGEDDTAIDMTPMLDIVFIMLIFFIVTTSFVKESGISVNRPKADTAERQERGNIMVGIKPNGEVWIDKRLVEIAAVRANIERLHAQNPEGSVVIVADKASQNGVLVSVMDQIRLAGIENVSLAASKD